jgi:NADH:ubiquinone oxidoreductase subunit F (NADH-binding)
MAAGPGRRTSGTEMELTAPRLDAEGFATHQERLGPLPGTPAGELIAELEASGLLGRGGAGFPVGRKWRSVAQRSSGGAVVLANGAEGEPLSLKDRSLMASRPHLVIDGALLAARAVGANDIIFYVGVEHRAANAAMRSALAERPADIRGRARIVQAPIGYVAGEESAAVHFVDAGDARPTTTPPRPFERGIRGRPTLVQNVESLALAALIARRGPAWYRRLGQSEAQGIGLITVSGAVNHAGVQEIELGSTLAEVAAAAGGLRGNVEAVLLGGYFGGWADIEEHWGMPLDAPSMRARGLAFGCGVVHFLTSETCGVEATARIMAYLASQSARQCGPCVFGLAAIAEATRRLAARSPQADDLVRLTRWSGQLAGRGACRHPDGAAGLLRSALTVFADDFAGHQHRHCPRVSQPARVAAA